MAALKFPKITRTHILFVLSLLLNILQGSATVPPATALLSDAPADCPARSGVTVPTP